MSASQADVREYTAFYAVQPRILCGVTSHPVRVNFAKNSEPACSERSFFAISVMRDDCVGGSTLTALHNGGGRRRWPPKVEDAERVKLKEATHRTRGDSRLRVPPGPQPMEEPGWRRLGRGVHSGAEEAGEGGPATTGQDGQVHPISSSVTEPNCRSFARRLRVITGDR